MIGKKRFFGIRSTSRAIALIALIVLTVPSCVSGQGLTEGFYVARQTRSSFERLTDIERRGFREALSAQDKLYDPEERMIRRPLSSPGYHTTLKGGFVHPTRDSLFYAVALLDSGEPERLVRAEAILRRVIALQDSDPSSRTYGIWPWFLEEPLSRMSPPDWNWADFCGVQLLQVALDHIRRLPAELAGQVKESILHAARSVKQRDVGPGYTNIALMGTYVTLVAGERFEQPELVEYGIRRLKGFYDYTVKHGSFSEYNSPTYTVVAIKEISRMLTHVRHGPSRLLLRELNRLAWRHAARRFHPPTRQWAGPHSRSYSTFLHRDVLAFIQRGIRGRVNFVPPAEAAVALDAFRPRYGCPADMVHYFASLPSPRFEKETFVRNPDPVPDIVGSTWLHPALTVGSVNCGDLWNQRRPLIAYWGDRDSVAAFRVRFLHDGYDYSSATFFSVQDKGDVLAAINFATDRGDRHPSLDPLKDGRIRAKDFRLRFLLEGVAENVTPPSRFRVGEVSRLDLGSIALELCVPYAAFDGSPVTTETGRRGKSAWLDVILYNGEEREVSFLTLSEAAVCFALRIEPAPEGSVGPLIEASSLHAELHNGTLSVRWERAGRDALALSLSAVPRSQRELRLSAQARIGDRNPWK